MSPLKEHKSLLVITQYKFMRAVFLFSHVLHVTLADNPQDGFKYKELIYRCIDA